MFDICKKNMDTIKFVAQNWNGKNSTLLKFNIIDSNGNSVDGQTVYKANKSGDYTLSVNVALIYQYVGNPQIAFTIWVNNKQVTPNLYSTMINSPLAGLSTINGVLHLKLNRKDIVEFKAARISGTGTLVSSSLDSVCYITRD